MTAVKGQWTQNSKWHPRLKISQASIFLLEGVWGLNFFPYFKYDVSALLNTWGACWRCVTMCDVKALKWDENWWPSLNARKQETFRKGQNIADNVKHWRCVCLLKNYLNVKHKLTHGLNRKYLITLKKKKEVLGIVDINSMECGIGRH